MSGPPRGERPVLTLEPHVPLALAGAKAAAALSRLAAELPEPGGLAPGSWIAVARGTTERAGWFRRSREHGRGVDLDVRCTALLLRGYVEIHVAGDVAYGRTPAQP